MIHGVDNRVITGGVVSCTLTVYLQNVEKRLRGASFDRSRSGVAVAAKNCCFRRIASYTQSTRNRFVIRGAMGGSKGAGTVKEECVGDGLFIYTLERGSVRAVFTNWGATLMSLSVPDAQGTLPIDRSNVLIVLFFFAITCFLISNSVSRCNATAE